MADRGEPGIRIAPEWLLERMQAQLDEHFAHDLEEPLEQQFDRGMLLDGSKRASALVDRPLTAAQSTELARRLDAFEADRSLGVARDEPGMTVLQGLLRELPRRLVRRRARPISTCATPPSAKRTS